MSHTVAVDVLAVAFETNETDHQKLGKLLVDEGVVNHESELKLYQLEDNSIACEILSSDFSLEYVESLLFENAKLRVAVDDVATELKSLSNGVAEQARSVAYERNRREFEQTQGEGRPLAELLAECEEECIALEQSVAQVKRRVQKKQKEKEKISKSKRRSIGNI